MCNHWAHLRQITPEARLTDDLGAASPDLGGAGQAGRETFNLSLTDEELARVRPVGNLHQTPALLWERSGQPASSRAGRAGASPSAPASGARPGSTHG